MLIKSSDSPRVAFGISEALAGSPDREIPRMLSDYLRTRFRASRPKKIWFGPWNIGIDSEHGVFEIVLDRSKAIKNGWRLMLASRRLLPPYIFASSKPPRYEPALLEVCRVIHSFLAQTRGIVDTRWYFQGSGHQTPAVRTPDELPWHES